MPGEILEEQRAFSRFEGGCILCATIEAELVDGNAANGELGIDGPVTEDLTISPVVARSSVARVSDPRLRLEFLFAPATLAPYLADRGEFPGLGLRLQPVQPAIPLVPGRGVRALLRPGSDVRGLAGAEYERVEGDVGDRAALASGTFSALSLNTVPLDQFAALQPRIAALHGSAHLHLLQPSKPDFPP